MLRKPWLIFGALILIWAVAMFYPIAPGSKSDASAPIAILHPGLASKIQDYMNAHDAMDAIVVADSDRFLFESGESHVPINTHSVRKSIMSALYGTAVN